MFNKELQIIIDILKGYKEIEVAYIFGSTVTGHGWKKIPDIDIAILINCDKFTFGEEVAETLQKELKREFDVVLLNYASLLLKVDAIINGKILFYRDINKKVDFEVKTLLEFYELEPLRKWALQHTKRIIKENKFL